MAKINPVRNYRKEKRISGQKGNAHICQEISNRVKLNQKWCKGCGLCIEICPKNVYDRESKVSPKGFREIIIKNPDLCNQCQLCELLCPDLAITIQKDKKDATIKS